MSNEPRSTRTGGYPWEKYASGEWKQARELPRVYAENTGFETVAEYLRDGRPLSNITGAIKSSGTKWARRRGYSFMIRTDHRAGKIFVKFEKKTD